MKSSRLLSLLKIVLLTTFGWATAVYFITRAGYPGVVCVTPMSWLLALPAATAYVAQQPHTDRHILWRDTLLLGAMLGLFQGLLYALIAHTFLPAAPDEQSQMLFLTALMILLGMAVCGLLSLMMGMRLQHLNFGE